jgi:hypothetical protein
MAGRQAHGETIYLAHAFLRGGYLFEVWWNVYEDQSAAIQQAAKNAADYAVKGNRRNAQLPEERHDRWRPAAGGHWEVLEFQTDIEGKPDWASTPILVGRGEVPCVHPEA